MSTVSFAIRKKPNADNLHRLELKIRDSQQVAVIQIKNIAIPFKCWDAISQTVIKTFDNRGKNEWNTILLDYKKELIDFITESQADKFHYTPKQIKDDFLKRHEAIATLNVYKYCDEVHDYFKAQGSINNAKAYITLKNSLKTWHKTDLMFSNINNDFLENYNTWLLTVVKSKSGKIGVTQNCASTYMRTLKSLINKRIGVDDDIVVKNPFKAFKISKGSKQRIALTIENLQKIKKADITDKDLIFARDLFLFSFYVGGISFIDVFNLKSSNFQDGYVIYKRYKKRNKDNNPYIKTVLSTQALEILSRYDKGDVFGYSKQLEGKTIEEFTSLHSTKLKQYNELLKDVATECEIVINGMKNNEFTEVPLTSVSARHSFATIALRQGISRDIISEIVGHDLEGKSGESVIDHYLSGFEQSVKDGHVQRICDLI